MPETEPDREEQYARLAIDPLEVCKRYRPKFGHGSGLSLKEFQHLYQADPFYSWFGFDSPLLYSAHKAAGGMTSVYRQLGIGCQQLFQQILRDSLGLSPEQSAWAYQVSKQGRKIQTLSLDGRITIAEVSDSRAAIVRRWLRAACRQVGVSEDVRRVVKGCVFEVRQGYKSKDSKRQNADIANAAAAYAEGYLPVLLLLSTQMDDDVADRYVSARWLMLKGTLAGTTTDSTYVFCRQVLGYDLADFFARHALRFRQEVEAILRMLLE